MRSRVQKWGNSLAIRIPGAFATEMGVGPGQDVEITVDEGRLVVSRPKTLRYTLEDLLAQVSDENVHDEIATGHAMGNETW